MWSEFYLLVYIHTLQKWYWMLSNYTVLNEIITHSSTDLTSSSQNIEEHISCSQGQEFQYNHQWAIKVVTGSLDPVKFTFFVPLSVMDLTSLNIKLGGKEENLTSEIHIKLPSCLLCISQQAINKADFNLNNNTGDWSDAKTMPFDTSHILFIAGIYICGTYKLSTNYSKWWAFNLWAKPPFGLQ